METKKLWQYKNQSLFEVETFHHCKSVYKSWKEFIDDETALTCNCIYGNPLLYWYWDNDPKEDNSTPERKKKNFKRVILIYRSWFSAMCKIVILVTYKDEPAVREFIYKAQRNQMVSK